jgi:hypothetical protein
MPAGWVHGHLGEITTIADAQDSEPNRRGIETVLTELFAGGHDGFIAWIGEQTKALAHAHDLAVRDADLETVIQFMQAKARRTRPFTTPELSNTSKRMNPEAALLFTEEIGTHP